MGNKLEEYKKELLPELDEIVVLVKGQVSIEISSTKLPFRTPVLHILVYKRAKNDFFEAACLEYAMFTEAKVMEEVMQKMRLMLEVFIGENLKAKKSAFLEKILGESIMEDYWALTRRYMAKIYQSETPSEVNSLNFLFTALKEKEQKIEELTKSKEGNLDKDKYIQELKKEIEEKNKLIGFLLVPQQYKNSSGRQNVDLFSISNDSKQKTSWTIK